MGAGIKIIETEGSLLEHEKKVSEVLDGLIQEGEGRKCRVVGTTVSGQKRCTTIQYGPSYRDIAGYVTES